MKTIFRGVLVLSAACLAAVLAGCGGSDGSRTAGIDGSGISVGPIDGFGSVLLNGRRYIVDDNTIVTVNDTETTQAGLGVGQYVVVTSEGTDAQGNPIARRIESDTLIEGRITAIDRAGMTLTILGQTVVVRPSTVIDNDFCAGQSVSGLDCIVVNDIAEVSGYVAEDGRLVATRIEEEDDLDDQQLIGVVSALSAEQKRFNIGALVVDYSAVNLNSLPNGELANSMVVRLRGQLGGNDVLNASRIQLYSYGFGNLREGARAEIEGSVTSISSATEFTVNNVPVRLLPNTRFEDGDASMINQSGIILEVEGRWRNGAIEATEIEFERANAFSAEATVEAISVTDGSRNLGSVTIMGREFLTNISTRFSDDSDQRVRMFGLDDLRVGDYIEVEGYLDGDDAILTELERDDADNEVSLEGPVGSSTPDTMLEIVGITVTFANNAEFKDDDREIGKTEFFQRAQPGVDVEVSGRYSGGVLIADEAEID